MKRKRADDLGRQSKKSREGKQQRWRLSWRSLWAKSFRIAAPVRAYECLPIAGIYLFFFSVVRCVRNVRFYGPSLFLRFEFNVRGPCDGVWVCATCPAVAIAAGGRKIRSSETTTRSAHRNFDEFRNMILTNAPTNRRMSDEKEEENKFKRMNSYGRNERRRR